MWGNIKQNEASQVSFGVKQAFNSKQAMFIFKACLIGGLGFALIFAIGFSVYVIANKYFSTTETNTLIIVASLLLFASIFVSVFAMGGKPSWPKLLISGIIFIFGFGSSFGVYFLIIGSSIMFYSFAVTAVTMIIMAIIAFVMKDKTALTIQKVIGIISITFVVVYFCSFLLIYLFVGWSLIWDVITTSILGIIILGSVIASFWELKKIAAFATESDDGSEAHAKELRLATWAYGFKIMATITFTFYYIVRLLSFLNIE
ncbi:MAG: hypothetical protein ACRC4L_02320 [Mycoplasma sp.]